MIGASDFLNLIKDEKNINLFKLAIVEGLFENGKAKIRFDGEEIASEKQYKNLSSYNAEVGDRVLLVSVSGTYIVLGNVV